MRTRLWMTCVAALGATVLAGGGLVAAQDRDRERDRDRDRLREHLRQEEGIFAPEWAALAPEVDGFLRGGGRGEEIRQMVRDAHAAGCRGECLAEALRSMNRARSHGLTDVQAREMVTAEVRAQVRERQEQGAERSDRDRARQLRERVESTFTHRERETERAGGDRPGHGAGSLAPGGGPAGDGGGHGRGGRR